jgi:ribosomal protein S18 acetylase RimI-like enzyme
MENATPKDKKLIVDILAKSFETNQSINYIVEQDHKRLKRIRALMEYSFEMCYLFGKVLLSDNKNACALILYPDKKKTTVKSILLDVKLIISCIGLKNIKKTLVRESKIKKIQPQKEMYYLWFIGVDPEWQHKGIGSAFLAEIIKDSQNKKRPVFLETSTLKNIPWYKKFDFHIYHELNLGYKLFFLSNE